MLYDEFQKIRSYKDTKFAIDPTGFEVQTNVDEDSYVEKKTYQNHGFVDFYRCRRPCKSHLNDPLTPLDLHKIVSSYERTKSYKA